MRQRNQRLPYCTRRDAGCRKTQPVQGMADTQVKAFAIDAHQRSRDIVRQTGQLHVMRNSRSMVGVHMFQHRDFGRAAERIGQGYLIQPVNGTKTTDVTGAYRLQVLKIEIMHHMVIT